MKGTLFCGFHCGQKDNNPRVPFKDTCAWVCLSDLLGAAHNLQELSCDSLEERGGGGNLAKSQPREDCLRTPFLMENNTVFFVFLTKATIFVVFLDSVLKDVVRRH